jgi:hypothetical protein
MIAVIARNVSDEAIQTFYSVLDCFRRRPSGYGGRVASLAAASLAMTTTD